MSEERAPDATQRWQRREKRRTSARSRQQKHGGSLRTVYKDAVLKRMRDKKRK